MVIAEFQIFQVVGEGLGRKTMEFLETFFSIAPEPFSPVDGNLPIGKTFAMVDPFMAKSVHHQSIVTPEPVRVDQTSSPPFPKGLAQQSLCLNLGNHLDFYLSFSLQDPKDRDLVRCSSALSAFPFAPKVALISLHLSFQQIVLGTVLVDLLPNQLEKLMDRVVSQPQLLAGSKGRHLQLK